MIRKKYESVPWRTTRIRFSTAAPATHRHALRRASWWGRSAGLGLGGVLMAVVAFFIGRVAAIIATPAADGIDIRRSNVTDLRTLAQVLLCRQPQPPQRGSSPLALTARHTGISCLPESIFRGKQKNGARPNWKRHLVPWAVVVQFGVVHHSPKTRSDDAASPCRISLCPNGPAHVDPGQSEAPPCVGIGTSRRSRRRGKKWATLDSNQGRKLREISDSPPPTHHKAHHMPIPAHHKTASTTRDWPG